MVEGLLVREHVSACSLSIFLDYLKKINMNAIHDNTQSTTITSDEFAEYQAAIIRAVYNEEERRRQEQREKASGFFGPMINRPHVFVNDPERRGVVHRDNLLEMMSLTPEIVLETSYNDFDYKDVEVFRCRIPDGYTARVPYVMAKHIPFQFMVEDGIVMKKMPPKGDREPEWVLLARRVNPVWTNSALGDISREEISEHYHWFTVKVRKEDQTLRGWFPGVDKNCGLCSDLSDRFVLVGEPHQKTERAIERDPLFEEFQRFMSSRNASQNNFRKFQNLTQRR